MKNYKQQQQNRNINKTQKIIMKIATVTITINQSSKLTTRKKQFTMKAKKSKKKKTRSSNKKRNDENRIPTYVVTLSKIDRVGCQHYCRLESVQFLFLKLLHSKVLCNISCGALAYCS